MKVCLLVDGDTISEWQANALRHLLDNTNSEVTALVYDEHERSRTYAETLKRALKLREWAPIAVLNRTVAGPIPHHDPVPLSNLIEMDAVEHHHVDPKIIDGWKQEIPEDVAAAVGASADIGIRFGFGFIVGPILSAFEHGVLSYHHGDLREYRGQPMGFWEFVNGEDTAGVTVQQITEHLDAGRIAALKQVDISGEHTWEGVKRRLLDESADMLTTAVRAAAAGTIREPESLGPLYSHPTGRPVATFAARNAVGHVKEAIKT
ncbi:formyltransferase family protein [Halobaculum limi]|uniref:formyltransferase family protein n=1 Tax=Halobaculum limi TaxID=3031916 RepID=UPI002405B21A|nr:formyltransferase family protein [Halobaculum sp. YSMS11]